MSKIEFKNINGFNIAFRNGQSLCSLRDPMREANQWYASQKWDFRSDFLVVLGVGSAFHLQVVQEKAPSKIIAIDFNKELIENARQSLEKSIDILHFKYDENFKSNPELQKLIMLDAQVVSFRPSWQGSASEFSSLKKLILGTEAEDRDWQESLFDATEVKRLSDALRSLS